MEIGCSKGSFGSLPKPAHAKKRIAGEVEANYLTASADVKWSFTEEERQGKVITEAHSWQTGGTVQLHDSIDPLSNAAHDWGQKVREQGFPVTAILADYSELDLPRGPSLIDLQDRKDFLSRMLG
jgi:hypothetical protein